MFAEGRVENQKLNQTAALFGFQLDSLEKHLITLTRVAFSHFIGSNSSTTKQPFAFFFVAQMIRSKQLFQSKTEFE